MDAEAAEAVCYVCLHSGQGLTRWCKCPSLLVHPLCAGELPGHGHSKLNEDTVLLLDLPD